MEINLKIKLENIEKCAGCPMLSEECSFYVCHIAAKTGADFVEINMRDIQRPQSCIDKFGR